MGLFVPTYVLLSLKVIRTRRKNRVPLGDGGNAELLKWISTHNNFSQYIPLALACMAVAEIQGAPSRALIGVGTALLIGRLSHMIGIVKAKPGPNKARVLGMILTFGPLLLLGLLILVLSINP